MRTPRLIMAVLLMAALAVPASAGVLKFTGKHVAKPAAKSSFKAGKATAHAGVKALKFARKVIW